MAVQYTFRQNRRCWENGRSPKRCSVSNCHVPALGQLEPASLGRRLLGQAESRSVTGNAHGAFARIPHRDGEMELGSPPHVSPTTQQLYPSTQHFPYQYFICWHGTLHAILEPAHMKHTLLATVSTLQGDVGWVMLLPHTSSSTICVTGI